MRPVVNPACVCTGCGGRTGDSRSLRCRPCSKRGSANPQWRGDDVGDETARNRAQRLYALGSCERCGGDALDRHHKDGNPRNNERSNIQILCRPCHMAVDGRSKALAVANAARRKPPRPCRICDTETPSPNLRDERCPACRSYFERHGVERPGQIRRRRAA